MTAFRTTLGWVNARTRRAGNISRRITGRVRTVGGGMLALAATVSGTLYVCAQETTFGVEVALAEPTAGAGAKRGGSSRGNGQNVLFIIADDLGVDVLEGYGEGLVFPPTPVIDQLIESGVLFRNAYSNSVCSPTRATIQTGRYSLRTGVGVAIFFDGEFGLPFSELIIPEVLDDNPELGYSHAAIGKWHLTNASQEGDDAPNVAGYDHFSGTMYNIGDYYDWPKTENGGTGNTQVYATTDNVDEAIEWINARGENPWFMWLAFNAPHAPIHAPPDDLHSFELPPNPASFEHFQAVVEAMDTEMGRLFASIPKAVLENTNILFLGDNGTAPSVTNPPFDPDHAKGTLYEGGINVPLIISGPGVVSPGRESEVLVNTTDLFATALELMGIDVQASIPPEIVLDSISVVPVLEDQPFEARVFVYSEKFTVTPLIDGAIQAIRNHTFKLIRVVGGCDEFYNLDQDPFETNNLLLNDLNATQQNNYEELKATLAGLIGVDCEGDVNYDGAVDPLDIGFVSARFGCTVEPDNCGCIAADLNGDGVVDPLDIGYVLARLGFCP